ncbi:hypothetical protein GYB57_02490 [bacterium]|nr:hypothetical protein [bacterium]
MDEISAILAKGIFGAILECSDKDFQFKVWIDGAVDTYNSSYTELCSTLFDDNFFSDFLYYDAFILCFGQELISNLKDYRYFFEEYNHNLISKKSDIEILKDSEWDKVVQQAKVVIELWKEDQEASKYINHENLPEYFK